MYMSINFKVNSNITNIINSQYVTSQLAPFVMLNFSQILFSTFNSHASSIQDSNDTLINSFVSKHSYNRMFDQQIVDRIEYNNHVK